MSKLRKKFYVFFRSHEHKHPGQALKREKLASENVLTMRRVHGSVFSLLVKHTLEKIQVRIFYQS